MSSRLLPETTQSSLPPEILTAIFEELPDLQALASVLHVCQRWYAICTAKDGRIAKMIFTKSRKSTRHYRLGEVFWNLDVAIKEHYMHRLHVKRMFVEAWPIFVRRQLEELLYPLGMALARTCNKDAEISLLQMVWNSSTLLHSSPPPPHIAETQYRWQPALIKVGVRLLELSTKEEERASIMAGMRTLFAVGRLLESRPRNVLVKKKAIVFQSQLGSSGQWPSFVLYNAPSLPFEMVDGRRSNPALEDFLSGLEIFQAEPRALLRSRSCLARRLEISEP